MLTARLQLPAIAQLMAARLLRFGCGTEAGAGEVADEIQVSSQVQVIHIRVVDDATVKS